jgi:hypothetical protein
VREVPFSAWLLFGQFGGQSQPPIAIRSNHDPVKWSIGAIPRVEAMIGASWQSCTFVRPGWPQLYSAPSMRMIVSGWRCV